MRRGYYEGIRHLKEEGRPGAVKAVILMGDGDWNLHGSPLAKGIGYPDTASDQSVRYESYETTYGIARSAYPWSGSTYDFSNEGYEWYSDLPEPKGVCDVIMSWRRYWPVTTLSNGVLRQGSVSLDGQHTNQNMSVYAMSGTPNEQVRVYTIGFAGTLDQRVVQDITTLSEATGGSYIWAGDEEDLTAVYTQIAGELITEAGVNITLHLSHDNIVINMTVFRGGDLFEYVPETLVSHYNTKEEDIVWVEGYPQEIDQTNDWFGITPPAENAPAYTLSFDIGTIYLHDLWQAEYKLRLLKDGTFELFGPTTSVNFEGDSLTLPTTLISVIPPIDVIGLDQPVLEMKNLRSTAPGPVTDILPIAWDLNYSGTGRVTQEIRYTVVDPMIYQRFLETGPYEWAVAGILYSDYGPMVSQNQQYSIDVSGLSGKCLVKVYASAPGSPDSDIEMMVEIGPDSDQAYIRIE